MKICAPQLNIPYQKLNFYPTYILRFKDLGVVEKTQSYIVSGALKSKRILTKR